MKILYLNRNFFFTALIVLIFLASSGNNQYAKTDKYDLFPYEHIHAGLLDSGKQSEKDCKCENGDKGEKGEKGEKGDSGEKGERGPHGLKGERGERGVQGIKGRPGHDGDRGLQGPPGEKGEKGDLGPRGEKGEKGDSGPRGEKGEKGDSGPLGEKGEKGDSGPRGEKGEKGDSGPRGEKGEKGESGEQGSRGEKGPAGEKGDSGSRGERGEQGFPGGSGDRGERGPVGEKGDPGLTDKELENIRNSIDENIKSTRKNERTINSNSEEIKGNSMDIKLLKKEDKKNMDDIYRNRVTTEKNSRKIFSIEGKNKVRDLNIQNNRERFIKQAQMFKSRHIEASNNLKTGSIVLRSITFRQSELLNFDVTGVGVIFVKKAKSVRGFSKGIDGQVLHLFNTGESVMALESDFILAIQKIRLTSKKLELVKDAGVTLICDGKLWRVLSISGRLTQ